MNAWESSRRQRPWVFIALAALCVVVGASALAFHGPARAYVVQLFRPDIPASFRRSMNFFILSVDRSVRTSRVVFLGDSHVQGLCATCVVDNGLNYGMGHDTVPGLAQRLADYNAPRHARLNVLLIGQNDLRRDTPEQVGRNYGTLVNTLAPDVPILALSILPVDERVSSEVGRNAKILRANEWIRSVCGNSPRCTYLDVHDRLTDPGGNLYADFHVGDGRHLNAKGYEALISTLIPAVADHDPS